jgi:prepilin-type N-terminal cleavage/methylation domain-containing protein
MLRIRGFTLIEIIIVIGILSITVGFVAPFSISQISENRVYESAAEFSSVLFLNQQYANSMKDGKAYAVEINNDGYSTISSLSEDLGTDGLLGYWKLNEKQWDGTVDEIVDSSGNDYNGKTVNGPIISKDGFTSSPYF